MHGRIVEADMDIFFFHRITKQLQIFHQCGRGIAIEIFHKFTLMLLNVTERIPKQLGDQIQAKLVKINAAARGAVRLLKNTAHVVFHHRLYIRLKNAPVRMRCRIMCKAGRIIPNIHAVANPSPIAKIGDKARLCAVGTGDISTLIVAGLKGMGKARFYRAKTHAHVLAVSDVFWRGTGIIIGKRIKNDVGKFLLQFLCDAIDKAQKRTCGRTLLAVNGKTAFALAMIMPIVLGNRDDARFGVFGQSLSDGGNADLIYVRIGQTKLCSASAANDTLSVDKGIIFGMAFPVNSRRHHFFKGMDKPRIRHISTHTRRNTMMRAIESATNRKTGILHSIGVVMLTVFDARNLSDVILTDRKVGDRWNLLAVMRKETASERFQKLINAINDAAISANDAKTFAARHDAKAIFTKVSGIDIGNISDIDTWGTVFSFLDPEGSRGHAVKIIAQLLCRIERRTVFVG